MVPDAWPMIHREDWASTLAELDAVQGDKTHCWCLATTWQPSGENQSKYGSNVILSWILHYTYGISSSCLAYCALYCSYSARNDAYFRNALFSN